MARRIVLLLGFLFAFVSVAPAQKEKSFKIKSVDWLSANQDLVMTRDSGEKYTMHLRLPIPFMEKVGEKKAGNGQLIIIAPSYEVTLQQRFINLFVYKILSSTSVYDKHRSQENKDGTRPKLLETFSWDVPNQKISTEIIIGTLKNSNEIIANEKLGYSFDLKTNAIACNKKDILSSQLEPEDADMLKQFLTFLAIYANESIEWYEEMVVEEQKKPLPPEKKVILSLISPLHP